MRSVFCLLATARRPLARNQLTAARENRRVDDGELVQRHSRSHDTCLSAPSDCTPAPRSRRRLTPAQKPRFVLVGDAGDAAWAWAGGGRADIGRPHVLLIVRPTDGRTAETPVTSVAPGTDHLGGRSVWTNGNASSATAWSIRRSRWQRRGHPITAGAGARAPGAGPMGRCYYRPNWIWSVSGRGDGAAAGPGDRRVVLPTPADRPGTAGQGRADGRGSGTNHRALHSTSKHG